MNDVSKEILRGGIYFANLGDNGRGSEQMGKRPVIIISNNVGNEFSPTLVVAVISSNIAKAKLPTHVEIGGESGLLQRSVIMLEQVRTIDKSRLIAFIGNAEKSVMQKVDEAIQVSLSIGSSKMKSSIERIIELQIYHIHKYECTMTLNHELGMMTQEMYKELSKRREKLFTTLKMLCEQHGLDYTDYYKPYGYEK